jgi:hypothetical protein
MARSSAGYRKAYEDAKQELAELLVRQESLEKRKVQLRKTIESLAELCENEDVQIEPSTEAAYLLENSTLAEEIRAILKAQYPAWLRPLRVKNELEAIGHDLSKYPNPQAAIHMVLKRMAQSGEAQEQEMPDDGKKAYRSHSTGLAALITGRYGQDPDAAIGIMNLGAGTQKFFSEVLAAGKRMPPPTPPFNTLIKRKK